MTGTRVFVRAFLRRDRWMMMWWVLGGVLLYFSQAPSADGLYATQAEFDRAAQSMEENVAFIAMTFMLVLTVAMTSLRSAISAGRRCRCGGADTCGRSPCG